MGVDPLRSPPCPLGGNRGARGSPTPPGKNTGLYLEKFQTFSTSEPRAKTCSSALLSSNRLPPSKAPLSTGRSWVQFLVMIEWKNPRFLRKISTFPTWERECNMCWKVWAFSFSGYPLRKSRPCSRGEKWDSPILSHDRMKIISIFSENFTLFRLQTGM